MRDVYVLTAAQALSASGMMTMTLLGGILGSQLAPSPGLATLPVSCIILGLALSTIPAALLMQRIGRRRAFIASALLASVAACAIAWAVVRQDFVLLCASALVLGSNLAFQLQHRFAAAECVPPGQVSTAISLVMVGTLVAAARRSAGRTRAEGHRAGARIRGSFIGVAALCLATALVLTAYREPAGRVAHAASGATRPLAAIVRQRSFLMAVLAGVVSYAVMSFIMTATPISMHVHDHHSDTATAWVIQSHLLAMYAPSLFSGRLIARIGVRAGHDAGLVLMLVCVAIDDLRPRPDALLVGAGALGVGWNLLFVAGTALLTTTYQPAERFRAQAVNEFSVFGSQALASLLAGPAIHALGWRDAQPRRAAAARAMALALLVPLGSAVEELPRVARDLDGRRCRRGRRSAPAGPRGALRATALRHAPSCPRTRRAAAAPATGCLTQRQALARRIVGRGRRAPGRCVAGAQRRGEILAEARHGRVRAARAADALPFLDEVRAILPRARRPRPGVEGLALPRVEHRHAGEHDATDLLGPRDREFDGGERPGLVTEQVHLAQAQRVEQVADRGRVLGDRRRRLGRVRLAATGQVRRVHAAVLAEIRQQRAEHAPGQRGRVACTRAARARRTRRSRERRCARATGRSGSRRTSCGGERSRAATSCSRDWRCARRCGSVVRVTDVEPRDRWAACGVDCPRRRPGSR